MKLLRLVKNKYWMRLVDCNWPKRDEMPLVQRFPIKDLYRTDTIYPDQVAYYKRLTPDHSPVVIATFKGKKFIWDGNHRVQARREKGFKTVRAFVFELECE